MSRISPIHYIAPTAISITPNANGRADDLAVNVASGAKIKVYAPAAGIGTEDADFQEWTFSGRNRRLSSGGDETEYTIYIRLAKNDKDNGYLVFAPKDQRPEGQQDKYCYVTESGLSPQYAAGKGGASILDPLNWWIRIGSVSAVANSQRTVTLDTGILGTELYNTEWNMDPDDMPLRVLLECTIDGSNAGPTPYVPWGKTAVLSASLAEGWVAADAARIDHWSIKRGGGAGDDATWAGAAAGRNVTIDGTAKTFAKCGRIALSHARAGADDFKGNVATTFVITAWGTVGSASSSSDSSSSSSSSSGSSSDSSSDGGALVQLAAVSITIYAETVEKYELMLSDSVVSYNPQSNSYTPPLGIDVRVRVNDQRGDVYLLTTAQLTALGLSVLYMPVGGLSWTPVTFSDDGGYGKGNIPTTAFSSRKSVTVRLVFAQTQHELTRATVNFTSGRIFAGTPGVDDAYDVGDLWVNATGTFTRGDGTTTVTYDNDILRCITAKAAGTAFSIDHWQLASGYTDDTTVNTIIGKYGKILGLQTPTAENVGEALGFLRQVLSGSTEVDGGLILSNMIALRNGSQVMSGMNGTVNTELEYPLKTPAAWYGGGMVDYEALTEQQQAASWDTTHYARSLFRFDGSGYIAGGRISWGADGTLSIKSNQMSVLVGNNYVDIAGAFLTKTDAANTYLSKTDAANTYLSIAFFNRLFQAHNGGSDVSPNDMQTTIDSIEAMFGFWTDQYLSARGMSANGGAASGLDWSQLTVYDNVSSHVIDLNYLPSIPWSQLTGVPTIPDSTKMGQWDAAYIAMHSHFNKSVLDVITSEKVTAWDNVAAIMDSPDSDSVVNKWHEVVSFLNTYTEADTLANLLSNKADKATVTAGTYTKLTVNSQGIVTAGTSLGDGDIPSLSISKVTGLQTALDSKLDIAFFSRLFQAHNGSADVNPNDTQTTIDSIEAMFGFWTDQYLSARGMSANGGAASGLDWSQLTVYDNVSSHVIDLNYLPSIPWSQLTGVPLTFAPSSHQHTHNDISDWSTVMAGYARIQHANDLMNSSTSNEFTFVSAGYGASYANGREVYINYHTADGTNGNISQYKFCNGAGGVLASISNGQFSGNAATASKTSVLYDPESPTKELLFVIPPDLDYFNNLPDEEGSLYYSGSSPEDYYAAVLKWLCRKYGTAYSGRQVMFVMRGRPNSLNFTLLTIYDPSRTNSAGLPEYSFGTAFPLGGSQSLLSFGTLNYVYYYNNGKVGYASTASNASALYGVDASMFLRFESRTNYLAARMLSPENAEKAASTYIEWWQSWGSETGQSGWFNHKAGQYIGLGLQISGDGYVLGNLGVGTSTPAVKLDVAGQLHTSDDITAIHSGTRDGSTVTASVALRFDTNNNPALTLLPSTDQSATARWQVQGDDDWMYLGSYMSSSMKIGATGNTVLANGASLTIGNCVISWDSVNQMLKFTGVSGQTFNGIYSTGAVSSLGAGALGFAGVIEDAMTFNDTVTLNDAVALNDNLTINAAKKVKFGTGANAVTIEKYQNGIKAAGVTLSDGSVSADEIEASSDITTSENINVGLTIVMDDQDDGTKQGVLSVDQGHLWFQYDGGTKVRII